MTDETNKPTDPQEEETLLTFPCEFVIKAFGLANPEFEIAVLTIIREHVPTYTEGAIIERPSENGKYMALSITITAESKAQIDKIYQAFTDSPLILMAL